MPTVQELRDRVDALQRELMQAKADLFEAECTERGVAIGDIVRCAKDGAYTRFST